MRESKKILLLGTGGHCRSVADSLIASGIYDEIALVGKPREEKKIEETTKKIGIAELTKIDKIECTDTAEKADNAENAATVEFMSLVEIGTEDMLSSFFEEGYHYAFVALGSIGDPSVRHTIYQKVKNLGFILPNIIDPSSVISKFAELGEGIFVGKNVVINAAAKIGNCAIINTGSIIEHDCEIGEYVHVSPGCTICGSVKVEADTHVGAGSVIKQGIHIGEDTMIGMGSIVLSDIGDHATAYGNPCRIIK
ncbi:MAG: acetyltransferase [Mobilitalea sp.]